MLKSKLFICLMMIWIAAGCQSTNRQQIASPSLTDAPSDIREVTSSTSVEQSLPPESNTQKAESFTDDPGAEEPEADAALLVVESKEIELQDESGANTIEEEPIQDSSVQQRIDQALELCNFAQDMWEKGKLDEAIINLDSAYFTILEIDSEKYPQFNQQKEDIRFLISKRILEIYASRQIVVNGQHNEIPVILNQYVNQEIKRLTGPERKFFIQSLERSYRFRPFIVEELKKAGLPEDLSWLPLIESGFKIRALSPARALGLWQFIPSTGYKFGLNRNYYIDERLDPEKSTRAAIAYLKELHNLFGDWTTALAAYNCGESRVLRTIRKQRINYLDNFWDLYQSLPRETSRYVPRFLATLHIVRNMDKYGIKAENPQSPVDFKVCEIKKQVRLKDIANEIGVSTSVLKDLNPELRYALLPAENYALKVPAEKEPVFLAKLDKIKTTYSPPPMYVYHRVRKGDTLSGIAQKYHSSIRAISQANNIGRSHRIIAGKVLKVPSRQAGAGQASVTAQPLEPGKTVRYTVKRGDNLWNIARKFATTTKHIKTVNNLETTSLMIGQVLTISSEKQLMTAQNNVSTYQVRSGDSPFSIAKKHKMSLNRLLALNHLDKSSKIFPGQTLIVE
jgi:membrane-bound lytic murein transglycosylase D